jgi:hypothetical protein
MERMAELFSGLRPEFQDFVLHQIEELLALQDLRREEEIRGNAPSPEAPSAG